MGFSSISTAKLQDIALVTGRLGYAANDWLFYVKGGGAWGHGKSFSFNDRADGTLFDTSSSATDRSGWVVGVGAEWGFAPNWSAKLEYNYIDFGSETVTLNSSLGTQSVRQSSQTGNIVRAGVNYRFNGVVPSSRNIEMILADRTKRPGSSGPFLFGGIVCGAFDEVVLGRVSLRPRGLER